MAGTETQQLVTYSTATNLTVWPHWNQTGSTLFTPQPATWANWNTAYATNSTSTTLQVAGSSDWLASPWPLITWAGWNNTYQETADQRAERERRTSEHNARMAAERTASLQARERALDLLGLVLSDEQMASYRDNGWFEILSSKGRRYRIRAHSQAGNVDLMPEIGEVREATFCAHPPDGLPLPDAHLAQALQLMADEDAFLAVANCRYRRAA